MDEYESAIHTINRQYEVGRIDLDQRNEKVAVWIQLAAKNVGMERAEELARRYGIEWYWIKKELDNSSEL